MTQAAATIHEAKTHLSRLIQRALAGEEIIIAKAGKPVVKLVPIASPHQRRSLGGWKGRMRIAEDFDVTPPDFEEYLP